VLKDLWQYLDTPEAREFKKWSNRAEKFLKHADRDPDGIYELDPEWTQAQMYEASAKFIQLTGEWAARMTLYIVWYAHEHPHIFRQEPIIQDFLNRSRRLPNDRQQFFRDFLPIVEQFVPPPIA
jgi:hypothetical protein